MGTQARLLVVDDISANRLILQRSLEQAGYDVLLAADGFEAVDSALENRPNLILLDIKMPGRDGLEVCTLLKSQKVTADIPVIFVTAVSETDQVLKAFAAGGCDYVTRPFRLEEVLARVSAHLRLREAEEELRRKNRQLETLAQQLAEANTSLAIASRTDPLTGLLNRTTWDEAVSAEHQRFERYGRPYSVIIIDVDHFKAYNDTQGHQAGDHCLQRVARAIPAACRSVDSVGRYGGEEFVVLAPDTQVEAAVKLAERIRKAIWTLDIRHPASSTADRITVCLGVAGATSGSWEEILRRADECLYISKRAGRNMVYGDHSAVEAVNPPAPSGDPCGAGACDARSTDEDVSVLVVDDDPTSRLVCCKALEAEQYRVRQAVDGDDALGCVAKDPPDVIVLDVMMPNMDGLECARRLKADPETCDIPIIMVTALVGTEDMHAGLEAGADEYLAKPIRPVELAMRVRSMARLHSERGDLRRSYAVRGEHGRVLTRLVEFCRAVATAQELDEILEHTIAAVAEIAHARRISIMLPDDDEQHLKIACCWGIEDEVAAQVRAPLGSPIAGQVYATARPVVINTESEAAAISQIYDSRFFASVPMLSAPLAAGGRVLGVLNATDRIGRLPFEAHELEFIELIGKVAAASSHELATRRAHTQACDSIMIALAKLAEHRGNDTGLHLERVTRYCHMLAGELAKGDEYRDQIDDAFLYDLARAAPLHDIGKVAIPDDILLHPGRLTDEQMAVMRTHATVGAKTIRSLVDRTPNVGFLSMAADITHYHHEWVDGTGYPTGLAGDAIPLAARIIALADVYDALTTKRIYKEAFSHEKARRIIIEGSGTQFDPDVVDAFLACEDEFERLATVMADEVVHQPRQLAAAAVSAGDTAP
ncbi:MAG: response regulator [bacterium]|nr:response regulator [bacterium]